MGSTLLAQASMPLCYWWDAFITSTFIINGLPYTFLKGRSPMEVLIDRKLNFADLRIFGCACYPWLKPYNSQKFQFKYENCIYLGPNPVHKGHKCLSPSEKLYSSRHVQFDELNFPFAIGFGPSKNADAQPSPQIAQWLPRPPWEDSIHWPNNHTSISPPPLPLPTNGPSIFNPPSSPLPISSHPPNSSHSSPLPPLHLFSPNASPVSPSSSDIPTHSLNSNPPSPAPLSPSASASPSLSPPSLPSLPVAPIGHPMITRAKAGIFKPKAWVLQSSIDWKTTEPTRFADAFLVPEWKAAMDSEYTALCQNHTLDLVPSSPHLNVAGCKWVFRIKRNVDGTIQRYKACLVAKGFHQSPRVDFFETFSSVVKASTIRVILSLAVTHNWELRQLDFNNTFLNGDLHEDVYMEQPPRYVNVNFPHHICKLRKSLYGLKQAPRAWNNMLKSALLAWGFVNSKSDTSLFIYRNGHSIVLLLIYVDDVILTGNNKLLLTEFVTALDKRFALKYLDHLNYFLGIQVSRLLDGLLLTQSKYVDDLLTRLNFSSLKPAPTPSALGKSFSINDGSPMADPFLYTSTVGALQYLTNTRPDISYIVNHLSQFLKQPTDVHW